MRIKICGVTRIDDALAAAAAGAHALGLNFYAKSPRFTGSAAAAAQFVKDAALGKKLAWAGVFVNAPLDEILKTAELASLDIIQLHGEEPPEFVADIKRRAGQTTTVWKAIRAAEKADLAIMSQYTSDGFLIDAKVKGAHGGTGQTFDWTILSGLARKTPLILSGGLTPDNVAEAVKLVKPDWVDVASGVESSPGVKDGEKMRRFVAAAMGTG